MDPLGVSNITVVELFIASTGSKAFSEASNCVIPERVKYF